MNQEQRLCVQTFRLIDRDQDNRISEEDLRLFLRVLYDENVASGCNVRGVLERLVSTRELALDYVELLDLIRMDNLLHGHESSASLAPAVRRLQGTRFSFTTADLESKMLDFGFDITQDEIEEVLELFTGARDGDITSETLAQLFSHTCAADLVL